MKIDRPDWDKLSKNWYVPLYIEDGKHTAKYILDKWFDEYVEPVNKLLAEGVEVVSHDGPKGDCFWLSKDDDFKPQVRRYQGLLINVQRIKKCKHDKKDLRIKKCIFNEGGAIEIINLFCEECNTDVTHLLDQHPEEPDLSNEAYLNRRGE